MFKMYKEDILEYINSHPLGSSTNEITKELWCCPDTVRRLTKELEQEGRIQVTIVVGKGIGARRYYPKKA